MPFEVMDDSMPQLCAGFQYKPVCNESLLPLAHVQCGVFPKSLENWRSDFLLVKAADYQVHLHVLKVLSDL